MENKPVRIQRKRSKGWRMPEGAVYVGRVRDGAGEFGNPFQVGDLVKVGKGIGKSVFKWLRALDGFNDGSFTKIETKEQAVKLYEEMLTNYPLSQKQIDKLKGKNLACWCALDSVCHADVLLKIVNP